MNRPSRRRLSPLGMLGLLMLVAALAVAAVGAWRLVVQPSRARAAASEVVVGVETSWRIAASPTATPPPTVGDVIATVRIPALGGVVWPVSAGTGEAQLRDGFGWYEWTAAPGAVGNFAVAGLRLTGPQPLRDIMDLEVGDEVVVETGSQILTYRIVSPPEDLTVKASDQWVLDPVPGHDEVPTEALITITTSEDLIPTADRTVAFGRLDSTEQK